jgi:hypothetical protein
MLAGSSLLIAGKRHHGVQGVERFLRDLHVGCRIKPQTQFK